MSINETLKQKIDELDLDRRLNDAVISVEQTVGQALDKASAYAATHEDDLRSWIDRAATTIDARTSARFTDSVSRVQGRASAAVTRLADRGGSTDEGPPPAM